MLKLYIKSLLLTLMTIMLLSSFKLTEENREFKVWTWMSGDVEMDEAEVEHYFQKASEVGVDAIFLECHGGYPAILDSTSFRDSAAIVILKRAGVYARKYGVELHAWMWTTNRCEKTLRDAHPDWYQVNGLGENLSDIKMYGREHYRFICPNHEGVLEYMKERIREIASIPGLTGIHLDFIRYPDAILPYGLHESRGVVQDKVYPQWDCCYCDECRRLFKEQTGIDPLDLEDPTSNEEWMQFRWRTMAGYASALAAEIKACGKVSSAAVFASPEESRKLVRQDWTSFADMDYFLPMIYNDSYAQPDSWVAVAAAEGIKELRERGNAAVLYPGVSVGRNIDKECLDGYFKYAEESRAGGICIFHLKAFERGDKWEMLKEVISSHRGR